MLQLNSGFTLPADNYRVYMPNQVDHTTTGSVVDTRVFDIYGNQLDGEFLGNQTTAADTSTPNVPDPAPVREPPIQRHESPWMT